ncbi:hypothetical protein GCM10010404_01210 [Nonomuraea africana]
MGHQGAQNQNTTGRPARLAPWKAAPSSVVAEKASAAGTGAVVAWLGAGVDGAGADVTVTGIGSSPRAGVAASPGPALPHALTSNAADARRAPTRSVITCSA